MLNYIYIIGLFFCIVSCQYSENKKNIDIDDINMSDSLLALKFKTQIKTFSLNLLDTINNNFSYEKSTIAQPKDSSLALNIALFSFYNKYQQIYPVLAFGSFKIYQYQQQKYIWVDIDFFNSTFWNSSNFTQREDVNILWVFKSVVKNLFIKLPYPCSIDTEKTEREKCDINSQMYVEAKNKKGQIVDISHYGQFEELNQFLTLNSAYHGEENKSKIDRLIATLQQVQETKQESKMSRLHYAKMPNNTTIFEPLLYDLLPNSIQKNSPDSARLKVRGVDFHKGKLYYLTNFISRDTFDKHNILQSYYLGYETKQDDITILNEYLQNDPPTFLYYKYAGSTKMPWYNYFIAYHIIYIDKIPKVTKIAIICPIRVYRYWCYPSGYCDDVNSDVIRSVAYKLN